MRKRAKTQPFHVVRWANNDRFQSYAIYFENEPYIIPATGKVIGKCEAYTIVGALNSGNWWPNYYPARRTKNV